jgi:hypothetical protein
MNYQSYPVKGKTEWMNGYIDIKTFTDTVNEVIKKYEHRTN